MSGPKACNFIKKRLWHRCFPVNFANFFKNTFGRLLVFRVNRESDYYAKSIYIKDFLWIVVLWMLVQSKILRISKNTSKSKFVRKYLLYVRWRSSTRNFTNSFVLEELFYTLGTSSFRTTWECFSIFFIFYFLAPVCQEFTVFCFFKNITPVPFSYN